MTPEEIAAHLNHNHIAKAAEWAAGSLARSGHAHLILTPGDATRYEIILLRILARLAELPLEGDDP